MDVGVKVKIDLKGVKAKLSPQALSRGRFALGNQAMSDMNQFVPMKDGELRQKVNLSSDNKRIIYSAKHAVAQFRGRGKKGVFRKYSTPGTGKRWDLKASSMYMNDWKKAFLRGSGIK